MTTAVTIKHEGPNHNEVMVRVVRPTDGHVYRNINLKMGESTIQYLYEGQELVVREIPKVDID